MTPLCSVFMPTYNHGKYIADAIEGCLMQKTDFPFQIVICDDCSTDDTRRIIDAYAAANSNIVTSYQPENSKGANNFLDGLSLIRTKYLAMCEGDDYWTDPDKLQMQVDFLEKNSAFTVSAHKVKILYEKGVPHTAGEYVYKNLDSKNPRIREGVFFPDEAVNNYYFQTSSFVFRWKFAQGLPADFSKNMLLDHFLFLLHAADGLIKYFDTPMSVWRHHAGGYTYLQNIDKTLFFYLKYKEWVDVYKKIDEYFDFRFSYQIQERILLAYSKIFEYCIVNEEFDKLQHVISADKEFFLDIFSKYKMLNKAYSTVFPEEEECVFPWATKNIGQGEPQKHIGSYKEFALDAVPTVHGSIWDSWTHDREYACFTSVEQALMHFLYAHHIEEVWLPNYYEPYVNVLRNKLQLIPCFYECGYTLQPEAKLVEDIPPHAAVITCAWFGKPVPSTFQRALAQRQDIYWIEDRRHVVWMGGSNLAPWAVYGPSETLGLPDGGILIGQGVAALEKKLPIDRNASAMSSLLHRLEKFEGYPFGVQDRFAFHENRLRAPLPAQACSRVTREMLQRIPLARVKKRALTNYRMLERHCSEFAYWKRLGNFVPFGFPALFPNERFPRITCDVALSLLAKKGVYCARKWNAITEGQYTHSGARRLSEELLLLPCDYRYDENDMKYIIDCIYHDFDNI